MPEVSIINCNPEVRKNTAQALLRLATVTSSQFSTDREENVIPSYIADYAISLLNKSMSKSERERYLKELQEVAESTQSISELFWARLLLRFEKENKLNRFVDASYIIRHRNPVMNTRVSSIISNPYKFATKLKEVL